MGTCRTRTGTHTEGDRRKLMSRPEGDEGESRFIAFLDVGHGDCCVFVNPASGEALVVDVPDGAIALEFLLEHGINELPFVLATHLDSDHAKGIPQLILNFCANGGRVRCLYYNSGRWGSSEGYRAVRGMLQK